MEIKMSRKEFKTWAKALRLAFQIVSEKDISHANAIDISHANALEILSRCIGFESWNHCSPRFPENEDEQIKLFAKSQRNEEKFHQNVSNKNLKVEVFCEV